MMLEAKGLLTPLIPDCSELRALTILKNIRNPLIFLRKMASYSCFWRVPRLKIFMQASLHQISNLLTLVSSHHHIKQRKLVTLRQIPKKPQFSHQIAHGLRNLRAVDEILS